MSDHPTPARSDGARPDVLGRPMSRRDIIRYLAYGSVGVAAGSTLLGCTSDPPGASSTTGTAAASGRGAADAPLLVIVELSGGNDGLSTLVPWEDGRYRDLRPTLALGGDEVIDWGDGWGINRRLQAFHDRKVAMVAGIGSPTPDLSHFEMLDRWWRGLPDGVPSAQRGQPGTGFLGRICDQIQGDERFTGVSLNLGNALALRASKAATTGLPDATSTSLDPDEGIAALLRGALDGFIGGGAARPQALSRRGAEEMQWMFELIGALAPPSKDFPTTPFGTQMALASRLLRSDSGVRVIHVPVFGARFDTHQGHGLKYPDLIGEIDEGVAAFLRDVDAAGLSDRVLLATTSEFGRRPAENADGLDHGAASTMMLLGPVNGGIHGEPSSLVDFDVDDNLVATAPFDRYLATLATWMQVEPKDVLGAGGRAPEPIPGVLRT